MTNDKPQEVNSAQAYGILAAAHADVVVENRLLRAQVMQLRAQIESLTPPPAEAAPADEQRAPLEAVK